MLGTTHICLIRRACLTPPQRASETRTDKSPRVDHAIHPYRPSHNHKTELEVYDQNNRIRLKLRLKPELRILERGVGPELGDQRVDVLQPKTRSQERGREKGGGRKREGSQAPISIQQCTKWSMHAWVRGWVRAYVRAWVGACVGAWGAVEPGENRFG